MVQVNVHQAKTQLSKLLEMVEGGKTVVIARNGKRQSWNLCRRKSRKVFPLGSEKAIRWCRRETSGGLP